MIVGAMDNRQPIYMHVQHIDGEEYVCYYKSGMGATMEHAYMIATTSCEAYLKAACVVISKYGPRVTLCTCSKYLSNMATKFRHSSSMNDCSNTEILKELLSVGFKDANVSLIERYRLCNVLGIK
jgi:hypothetical protein